MTAVFVAVGIAELCFALGAIICAQANEVASAYTFVVLMWCCALTLVAMAVLS